MRAPVLLRCNLVCTMLCACLSRACRSSSSSSTTTRGCAALASLQHTITKAVSRACHAQTHLRMSLKPFESTCEPFSAVKTIHTQTALGAECVVVELPVGIESEQLSPTADLCDEEVAFATQFNKHNLAQYVGGRVAMHRAFQRLGVSVPAILKDPHGAPVLPCEVTGSISHKHRYGVALASVDGLGRVGVDIEQMHPRSIDIRTRVLTDEEQKSLGQLPGLSARSEVLLRFSLKESLYKATQPFVPRFIGFKEAEVYPHSDGTASCRFLLCSSEGPFNTDLRWQVLFNKYFLTFAHVRHAHPDVKPYR